MEFIRPWGNIDWLFSKFDSNLKWDFIGCLSTEDRCQSGLVFLQSLNALNHTYMLEIRDPDQSRWKAERDQLLNNRHANLLNTVKTDLRILNNNLLSPAHIIVKQIDELISASNGNLVIDISSFPKRFFFIILKRLYFYAKSISNIVILYTRPEKYGNSPLAEDTDEWQNLPLFGPVSDTIFRKKLLIIGVGFEPFGLPHNIQPSSDDLSIELIFPFPPGPPSFHRTLDFVERLKSSLSYKKPIKVNAMDVSATFDHISSLAREESYFVELAPFGPKPISLAMCLYACVNPNRTAIYYTQPKSYNPYYSTGTAMIDDTPEIFSYCIKLEGKNLYQNQ